MPFLDISQVGNPIKTGNTREVRFNCPYCGDEEYHLYVNVVKRVWFCQRCNAKGKTNIIGPAIESIHFTSIDKPEKLDDVVPIKLPRAYRSPEGDFLTKAAFSYLKQRDIRESDVRWHKIYCAAVNTIYFGRLIIPCNARAGHCTYFTARAYTKLHYPKYLNPPNAKSILFHSPVRQDYIPYDTYWEEDEVVLVEGPVDYIKTARHGNTIALLGKTLSNMQARVICSTYNRVYIMLDQGNREALAAIQLADMLRVHTEVKILQCPKKDPGEMTPENFKELMS